MRWFTLIAALALPAAAAAQDDDTDIDVEGRVFVRHTITEVSSEDTDTRYVDELAIDSARVTVDYRRGKELKVNLEVDFGDGDADLKDAYIRVRPGGSKRWEVTAGQFKRPISPLALESPWRLPTVERGLLSEVTLASSRLTTDLPFGGRGVGIEASYRFGKKTPLRPRLTVAVFRAETEPAQSPDLRDEIDLDPYARVELQLADGIQLGVTGALVTHEWDVVTPAELGHAPWLSADIVVAAAGFNLVAEGYVGRSVVFERSVMGAGGTAMWAARTLASYRMTDLHCWVVQLEPFVTVSVLDPRGDDDGDLGWELGGGVAWHLRGDLRLQLHIRHMELDDAVLYGSLGGLTSFVQLGASF